MAHFAKLDENNIVENVIVVDNQSINNIEYPESEKVGQDYIASIGLEGTWKQTSYNNNFRLRYAGIGYTYLEEYDVFVYPKIYPSWTLDTTTFEWIPPVPYPTDDKSYVWDEDAQEWFLYVPPPGTVSIPAAEQNNGN